MTAIFELLRNRFQIHEVKAWADARNTASHALAKKLGMTLVETIKDADFYKGQKVDEYVFAKSLK